MKKIVVKLSNERLITPSGLTLVGGALRKSDLVKRANRMAVEKKRSQPQMMTSLICTMPMVKWSSITVRSRPTWMLSGFLPVNSTPMNWCWN